MPALKPTDHYGVVTWLGASMESDSIRSASRPEVELTFDGLSGSRYSGRTRQSCSRVVDQHPRGTKIANVRQVTILSAEEMAEIAAECGLQSLNPEFLGANIVIEGIEDFTHVPPSSRLQAENGMTLIIDMENRPCNGPAREIETDLPSHGKPFKAAAKGRRGVTAWVERPGSLRPGDRLRLHIPDQPAWRHG